MSIHTEQCAAHSASSLKFLTTLTKMETRRVLTTSDMANINILIFGLRQDIENLQQRVDTQNDTIDELTRQLHRRDQIPDDDTIHPEDDLPALPSPHSARSSLSPAPANQAPLSPPSSPQVSPPPPATSQSQALTSIVNQKNDEVMSKSIILSGIGLLEILQRRLNNQHEILGQFIPSVKRALFILGLEELSCAAVGYKLFRSGALRIQYAEQIEARRMIHRLRSRIGDLKRLARERFPDTHDNELMRLDPDFRMAKTMKFSLALSGRLNETRKIFQTCAKILKIRRDIACWDLIFVRNTLVMKTLDKRKRRKFFTLEEAAAINSEGERREQLIMPREE